MKRDECSKKLIRMIEAIQSGSLPARVREFYVFGSYSRGALEPGDVDVVIVHDRPPRAYEEAIKRYFKQKGYSLMERLVKASAKINAAMRRPLRKPGEKVQIILTQELEDVLGEHSKIKREDLMLLWSETDQDYRSKLEAIRPDPGAGRAPRDHLVNLKRMRDSVFAMEYTVEMVRKEELVLTRMPIERIDCRLNDHHARRLAVWTQMKVMGKDSMTLLPYAMSWLQHHRQVSEWPDSQCVVWSKSGTHRVHLGRPSLGWMLDILQVFPKVRRQCLIPHIKRGQTNELLVFERGSNWSNEE
jgi:predicted nucleotidyltransferase